MKKYLFGIAALVLAISFSAFKTARVISFHYIPSTVSEANFENYNSTSIWEVQSSNQECAEFETKPCIIEFDGTLPSTVPGVASPTDGQKLSYFLSQRTPLATGATTYVNNATVAVKP